MRDCCLSTSAMRLEREHIEESRGRSEFAVETTTNFDDAIVAGFVAADFFRLEEILTVFRFLALYGFLGSTKTSVFLVLPLLGSGY